MYNEITYTKYEAVSRWQEEISGIRMLPYLTIN